MSRDPLLFLEDIENGLRLACNDVRPGLIEPEALERHGDAQSDAEGKDR